MRFLWFSWVTVETIWKQLLSRAEPDTRIFSPRAVAGLCVTIGRYWYLFKRLTAVSAGRFSRFEPIRADGSGKVMAKSVKKPEVSG